MTTSLLSIVKTIDMTSDTFVRLTGLVLPALVTAARFGPFFRWEPWSPEPGWLPWARLCDGAVAAERVGMARETLIGMFGLAEGEVPTRVVASVTFLGYAARVVSPLLAATVAGGDLPAPTPDEIWWQPRPGGPLPMAYGKTQARPCRGMDPAARARALADVAVGGLLTPLEEAFRARFRLSPKVLWGNVASALGGAARMIAEQAPELTGPVAAVVSEMLTIGPLAGMARPLPPRRFLIRNNCCLYYRIPGGGTCGDCVLTEKSAPGVRSAAGRS
jgi:ferric iron reductase protein FhuF